MRTHHALFNSPVVGGCRGLARVLHTHTRACTLSTPQLRALTCLQRAGLFSSELVLILASSDVCCGQCRPYRHKTTYMPFQALPVKHRRSSAPHW